MKLKINKVFLVKLIRFLKWGKIIAKLAAIGTTISGAVTALTSSATTGVAISAAGATTYAATKGLAPQTYEKTKHIPPGRVDKAANMMRKMEMDASKGARGKSTKQAMAGKSGVLAVKQPAARSASNLPPVPTNHIVARKK